MRTHRTVFLVPVMAAMLAAGCGSATFPTSGSSAAQARANAYATVAARLYREETTGRTGKRNAARIAHDPRLVSALLSRNHAAIRAAALRELFLPVKHVVRIRVTRRRHTVVDVGGRFVSGAESAPIPGLGRVQISMQDILGLTKLVTRFTGAKVVVHGRPGHVVASSPSIRRAKMPASGRVVAGHRAYEVRTIRRTGFGGEPLRISVLVPA